MFQAFYACETKDQIAFGLSRTISRLPYVTYIHLCLSYLSYESVRTREEQWYTIISGGSGVMAPFTDGPGTSCWCKQDPVWGPDPDWLPVSGPNSDWLTHLLSFSFFSPFLFGPKFEWFSLFINSSACFAWAVFTFGLVAGPEIQRDLDRTLSDIV